MDADATSIITAARFTKFVKRSEFANRHCNGPIEIVEKNMSNRLPSHFAFLDLGAVLGGGGVGGVVKSHHYPTIIYRYS